MLFAVSGMSVCAGLGVEAAHSTALSIVGGGAVANVCGLLTRYGQPFCWLTPAMGVAFFLATAPGPDQTPLSRGAWVLCGGFLQCAIVFTCWRLRPFGAAAAPQPAPLSRALGAVPDLRAMGRAFSGIWEHRDALAAGVMTATAFPVEREFHPANGYWTPMTALIILKPQRRDTNARTAQRILGALSGGGAVTLIAALARPDALVLFMMAVGLAWATYALQRVNYAVLSFGITSVVACLLSVAGLPQVEVARRRILATLLGGLSGVVAGAAVGGGSSHSADD